MNKKGIEPITTGIAIMALLGILFKSEFFIIFAVLIALFTFGSLGSSLGIIPPYMLIILGIIIIFWINKARK